MIEAKELTKTYNEGKPNETKAVIGVSIKVKDGSIVALTGPSGCGKTTLLSIMGLILTPTSGELFYDGEPVLTCSEDWKTRFRREKFGFIFQHINLLPQYTALENVLLPLYAFDVNPRAWEKKAMELLDKLGVSDRSNYLVEQLSGGEQQRVAFVRALVKDPKYIFADEPTVFVDEETSNVIYRIISELRENGKTIIISTHDPELMKIADVTVRICKGSMV